MQKMNLNRVSRTENGYIEQPVPGTFHRYYYLKDHLGNNRIVMNASGTAVQMTNYYPSGVTMAGSDVQTNPSIQPYKFGNKELDRTNGMDFYDFEARVFDPTLMRFLSPDPLAEKYYSVSPYVYCLNNPVRYVDLDGKDIKLFNIVKYDNNGNPTMGYSGKVSAKTESALKDLINTIEERSYFAQYAQKGDVVGGYTFQEDGKLNNVTLTLVDYSMDKENGNVALLPGSGSHTVSENNATVDITVVSYGVDKYSVGETLTHEIQLHGYSDANVLKGEQATTGEQDHSARKHQDTKHQGYKQYKSVQEQLQKVDEKYKAAFDEAQREANRRYK
jgi:RHS repeat-associated protein